MFGQDNEPVTLKRDLEALTVPAGISQRLAKDSLVYITQAMGGSCTQQIAVCRLSYGIQHPKGDSRRRVCVLLFALPWPVGDFGLTRSHEST